MSVVTSALVSLPTMSSEVGPSGSKQPTVEDAPSEHEPGSESDGDVAPTEEPGQASGKSKKKKKKKKPKAAKILAALQGGQVPDAVVSQVTSHIKEQDPEHAELDEDEVRKAFKAMKVMEMLQGKAGIGGKNAKDLGEHKVVFTNTMFVLVLLTYVLGSFGRLSRCRN